MITTGKIQDATDRSCTLREFVKPLLHTNKINCYQMIEPVLGQLSRHTRADLFSDLSALMPVLLHLGTDDTPREIYEAVRDVTTWWP